MTALDKYSKLEGPGLWTPGRDAQRRDVLVCFGEATLVICDSRSMAVLSHWSLPAVIRVNPGVRPALFRPEGDSDELLELEDDWLVDALKVVQAALRPPPGLFARLRRPILTGVAVGSVLLAALIVPPALRQHTASVVPMAKRMELGERLRAELIAEGAQLCESAQGIAALVSLQRALFQNPAQIVVLRGMRQEVPRILPVMGRYFLVDSRLLDEAQSPEALSGALLIAAQRTTDHDPLAALLKHAGVAASFRLLTAAEFPEARLRSYANTVLRTPLPLPQIDPLLERFARVELSTRPLLDNPFVLDPSLGVIGPALRDRNPMAGEPELRALLSDGQWVSLQNICDG
ncbi:MAG: hypothetical protein ACXIU7_04880 [Roseinatronobacter sp.]